MNILMLGNFEGRGWDGSVTDENHIHDALEELGHQVKRLQRGNALPLTKGELGGFDFILVAQWDGYDMDWVHAAKNYYSCPLVYWAFDYQADGQEWHERLIAESDLYLSKRLADGKYPNWQWLSQDFAPKFLDKSEDYGRHNEWGRGPYKDIAVLFTGSYLPWAEERNATLKAVDDKFNLVIHSVNQWPGFKDVRPPIMDEGLPELYARARVILSIDHTLEAGYWSDRNAQIMCCGEKPLFRYVPLSEATFHNHVDYFYDIDSCLKTIESKLAYIGSYELETESYEYAQANLQVINRVQDLLTIAKGIL